VPPTHHGTHPPAACLKFCRPVQAHRRRLRLSVIVHRRRGNRIKSGNIPRPPRLSCLWGWRLGVADAKEGIEIACLRARTRYRCTTTAVRLLRSSHRLPARRARRWFYVDRSPRHRSYIERAPDLGSPSMLWRGVESFRSTAPTQSRLGNSFRIARA
jgi:hypothetical protein